MIGCLTETTTCVVAMPLACNNLVNYSRFVIYITWLYISLQWEVKTIKMIKDNILPLFMLWKKIEKANLYHGLHPDKMNIWIYTLYKDY